jgi:hypothetical protein
MCLQLTPRHDLALCLRLPGNESQCRFVPSGSGGFTNSGAICFTQHKASKRPNGRPAPRGSPFLCASRSNFELALHTIPLPEIFKPRQGVLAAALGNRRDKKVAG